jgi:hypothetical protein
MSRWQSTGRSEEEMSMSRLSRWPSWSHRRAFRSVERCLGLLDDGAVLEELRRWALSLPWVIELEPTDDARLVVPFAIDCPPLQHLQVWFSIDEVDACVFEVHVFLPRDLAQRGAAAGWAQTIHDIDPDVTLAAVAAPATAVELQALEALLVVVYSQSFPHSDGGVRR